MEPDGFLRIQFTTKCSRCMISALHNETVDVMFKDIRFHRKDAQALHIEWNDNKSWYIPWHNIANLINFHNSDEYVAWAREQRKVQQDG